MTTKKTVKKAEIVRELAEKLLELMGTKSQVEVSEGSEPESFVVSIVTSDASGLLIGRHGETLNSIQTILGMMFKTRVGEWARIVVNCGDWREKQEDRLKILAKETAEKAMSSGEDQPLYNLTPAQRRIIHMELAENPEVETESVGEGNDRYLVVKPKGKK